MMLHGIRKILPWIIAVILIAPDFASAQSKTENKTGGNSVRAYRLTGNDEGFSIEFPDGKIQDIELSGKSDPVARNAMRVLKYEVFLATLRKPSPRWPDKSAIFMVGIIGEHVRDTPPTKTNMEGTFAHYMFELKGWFICVPYIDYPGAKLPDGPNMPLPRKRTTLEPGDFLEPIDPKIIHYDKAHKIYWIGMNPYAKN